MTSQQLISEVNSSKAVFQAESMVLNNFTKDTVTYLNYANNNQPLETITFIQGTIGQTSTASFVFNGTAGTYDVITRFIGKISNGASYTLLVNNSSVDQWASSERYGSDYKDPKNIDTHTSSKITLKSGDTIKLTAISNTEVARVDSITVQKYVGAPTSPITLDSPNKTLNDGFNWAKNRALGLVFYPGNPMLGHEAEWWRLSDSTHNTLIPGYWGAYLNRESYYNRDIAHQSDGAHLLGLDIETFNMLKTFAETSTRTDQHYWPLWAMSSYGLMYYIDGTGFRELPSPFDVIHKCYKQYLWTGNPNWINDTTLNNYYTTTTGNFLTDHAVVWNDADPSKEQPVVYKKSNYGEFSATYTEDSTDAFVCAGDSLALEYQSLLAYAGILKAQGNTTAATIWENRANRLKNYFEAHWYDSYTGRYIRGFNVNGGYKSDWGHENSIFMPLNGLGDYGPKTDAYLAFIDANDDPLNVEATTYLPEMYYKYNKTSAAWNWINKTLTDKNTYPEVSFTAISNIIEGMMGIQPDAPNKKVATISRLTPDVPWVQVNHIPVGSNDIKVRHDGLTSTTFTNNSGGTITWEAQFYGLYDTIFINGVAYSAQFKSLFGKNVSYVTVSMNNATTTMASVSSIYLSDLNWMAGSTIGYSTIKKDKSVDGNILTLNGTTYEKGIGTHANSTIIYNLSGKYSKFTASVGIDDEVSSNGTVCFKVLGDNDRELFSSGPMNGSSPTQYININIKDVNQLKLVVTDCGDGITNDHADWANAKLWWTQTYLSDLTWTSATTGYGTIQKDKSIDGHTISLKGRNYTKGIGTHANSQITYNLGGQYSKFKATVGIDEEVGSYGTVSFQVLGDDTNVLYDSKSMNSSSIPQDIDVSVKGFNKLTLKVLDGGDGITNDHADWANAMLIS